MKKIPAFVRGMVIRAVEESCRKSGLDRVTVEELERIRARMPTPKMFGQDASKPRPNQPISNEPRAPRLLPWSSSAGIANVRARCRNDPAASTT